MEFDVISCSLPVEEIPGLFREAVEGRSIRAKLNRVNVYTPDFGPYLGVGGITDPVYSIAVEVEPVNSVNSTSGGTIIMLVEPRGSGSLVAVITERWSRLSFSKALRVTRDGLVERLKSASVPRSAQQPRKSPAPPPAAGDQVNESATVGEISLHAHGVAEFLTSSGGSTFEEISESCNLTLQEVSEAIKELETAQAVSRRQGGVYDFTGELQSSEDTSTSQYGEVSSGMGDFERTEVRIDDSTKIEMSAAERIEKLESAASLLDRSLITPEDFDQLRRELLG